VALPYRPIGGVGAAGQHLAAGVSGGCSCSNRHYRSRLMIDAFLAPVIAHGIRD
jgi:hypothetical protein